MAKKSEVPHPGQVLLQRYLEPNDLSQYRLARDCGVPPRRINEIVLGRRGISADTALRLARYFGNEPRDWLDLQVDYELAEATLALGKRLTTDVKPMGSGEPKRRRGRPRKATTAARSSRRKTDLEDHLL